MTSNHHAPYDLGSHVLQWTEQGQQNREVKPIPQICSQFGSQSATRLREAGIASNRGSACRGEYVPRPCTHRPSHHEFVTPEVGEVTFRSQPPKVGQMIGVKS